QPVVPLSAGHAQRVLRLAAATGIGAGSARSPAEGADPGLVCGQQGTLRQPADLRGPAAARRTREPQTHHSADAGREAPSPGAKALQADDAKRPPLADGPI